MHPQNIAVIGSGISGLSAAWLLAKNHKVTVFEKDDKLGGHTNTVDLHLEGKRVPVDTGFICFNSASYPNLIAFFDHLNVPVHDTNMSFAASLKNGRYEYSGGTYLGLFGQLSNLFKIGHWRMIKDILRFFKEAPKDLVQLDDDESLATYLAKNNYSTEFANRHLLPMAAAIWSSNLKNMMDHPAKAFIQFFQNHGLLQVSDRPKWGTVDGGAQIYIDRILGDSQLSIRTSCPISSVRRTANGVEIQTGQGIENFDHVIIATHADQALECLRDPSPEEQSLLGTFSYSKNTAVLHRDRRLMPKRKLTWASWNYLDFTAQTNLAANENQEMCLTYWMNSLQNLNTREDVFVTLNPPKGKEIEKVERTFEYSHPVFNAASMAAQREFWSLQGTNRTWYCGAHFGAGFHEDGIQSGLAVAEQLGGMKRPWSVENESSRIFLHPSKRLPQAAE